MNKTTRIMEVLSHMRYILGVVNPEYSYWCRRVDAALIDNQKLDELYNGIYENRFHDF